MSLDGWVRVATTAELLPGETCVAWDGDTPILVVNHEGMFHALEDRCTHEDYELSAGAFDNADATIECVLHGARFDIRDGRPQCGPADVPGRKIPGRGEDGGGWARDDP